MSEQNSLALKYSTALQPPTKFVGLLFGVVMFLVATLFTGCGDSDNNDVEFSGNVVADSTRATAGGGNGIGQVEVMALGQRALTSPSGFWSFDVEDGTFDSGPVLFTLMGNGVSDQVVVGDVSDDAELIIITFAVGSGGRVSSVATEQEDFDEADRFPDDADDEADEAADDFDDEADETADDVDDETDQFADDFDDEADETADDIDDEADETFDEIDEQIDEI